MVVSPSPSTQSVSCFDSLEPLDRHRRSADSTAIGWLCSATIHLSAATLLTLMLAPRDIGRGALIQLETVTSRPREPAIQEFTIPLRSVAMPRVVESLVPFEQDPFRLPTLGHDAAGRFHFDQPAGSGRNADHVVAGASGSFFGTTATGDRFVYLLDMSTSMAASCSGSERLSRFEAATAELARSIEALTPNQQFYVFLFCYKTRPMFDMSLPAVRLVPATNENKYRLKQWLEEIELGPGTDPRVALRTSLALQPSAVFLLSDGAFNGQTSRKNRALLPGNPTVEQVVARRGPDKIPVHTIAFEEMGHRERMHALALSTGGTYQFVKRNIALNDHFRLLRSDNIPDVLVALRQITALSTTLPRAHRLRLLGLIERLRTSEHDDVCRLAGQAWMAIQDSPPLRHNSAAQISSRTLAPPTASE